MAQRMRLAALLPAILRVTAAAEPPFEATGNIVEATLLVSKGIVKPDGVPVTGYTVNGSVWGPLLEAVVGDTWRITVINNISDEEWSMHFHGQHVWGSPWEDGTGYVTSWAIPPGQRYTYEFPAYPSGTHFYHSHMGAQRMSGGSGPMIVRPPTGDDPYESRYVGEHILGATDWWHLTWRQSMMSYGLTSVPHCFTFGGIEMGSGAILGDHAIVDAYGVRGIPSGDNGCWNSSSGDIARPQGLCVGAGMSDTMLFVGGLVSGVGSYNWTEQNSQPGCWGYVDEDKAPECGTACGKPLNVTVERNRTYRFRLIGNMALFALQVCIDHHNLTIIGTDGRATVEKTYDCVILNPGERFDALVVADKAPGAYKIRFTTLEENLGPIVGGVAQAPVQNQFYAVMRYDGVAIEAGLVPPASDDYFVDASTLGCATLPTVAMPRRCHSVTELQPHPSTLVETPPPFQGDPDVSLEVRVQFLGDPVTCFGNMDKAYHHHNSRLFAIPLNESESSPEGLETFRKYPGKYMLRTHSANHGYSPSFVLRNVPVLLAAAGGTDYESLREEMQKPTVLYEDPRVRVVDDAVGGLGKLQENRVVVQTTVVDIPVGTKLRLVFNGRAGPSYANHPLHLHAHAFQLRGVGAGNWHDGYESRLQPAAQAIMKDTMLAYLDSWIAVDVLMNKPGIWMMHCHQIVHSYGGMALLFNVSAQKVQLPSKFYDLAPASPRLEPVSGPLTDYTSPDGKQLIGRCVGILRTFHATLTPAIAEESESIPSVPCPFNNVGAGCFTARQSGDVLYQDQVHRITDYHYAPARYSVTKRGLLPFTSKSANVTPELLAYSRSWKPSWEALEHVHWVLLASCPDQRPNQSAHAKLEIVQPDPEAEPEPEPKTKPDQAVAATEAEPEPEPEPKTKPDQAAAATEPEPEPEPSQNGHSSHSPIANRTGNTEAEPEPEPEPEPDVDIGKVASANDDDDALVDASSRVWLAFPAVVISLCAQVSS